MRTLTPGLLCSSGMSFSPQQPLVQRHGSISLAAGCVPNLIGMHGLPLASPLSHPHRLQSQRPGSGSETRAEPPCHGLACSSKAQLATSAFVGCKTLSLLPSLALSTHSWEQHGAAASPGQGSCAGQPQRLSLAGRLPCRHGVACHLCHRSPDPLDPEPDWNWGQRSRWGASR